MKNSLIDKVLCLLLLSFVLMSCSALKSTDKVESRRLPNRFYNSTDTSNVASINWRTYFDDPHLIALIDTALKNNQELNIFLQELQMRKNEIRARKGEYLPFVNGVAGAGVDKAGRYTRMGAVESQLSVKPGVPFPDPVQDYLLGAQATWEVDIWKKLRNAKKAAVMSYLSSVEGRNLMVTQLIAEIADAYYEIMAMDNLLEITSKSIEIQSSALSVVRQQKDAARVTQLAVNRFEAQLLNTQNLQNEIKQQLVETENRIRFLTGSFEAPVIRNSVSYLRIEVDSISSGIPSALLSNRPDIRQAEYELEASKLNVKIARANFYPSFGIRAGVGFQSFNTAYLISPEAIMYNLAGDLVAPLINRNAIKAAYSTANARQIQAAYTYEQVILNAYLDVLNQLSKIENYRNSFDMKNKEATILSGSVTIANNLFNSARADYGEVLLTQREALESRMELIEIKNKQLSAKVNIYRALGGGWR
ncbi:TolC family protein [Chryseotalea sanaruensis]|uniref:TolC family protein n=1 Tax=Chryseotalea sanaruensis TaxID=2482724 RepID=A0A401UCY1_9BACT|nr:TolC family protein [Chryseotalea sanaruensis]GCC52746.1 TolC family protein [Chryseotalea sanaruensis]